MSLGILTEFGDLETTIDYLEQEIRTHSNRAGKCIKKLIPLTGVRGMTVMSYHTTMTTYVMLLLARLS